MATGTGKARCVTCSKAKSAVRCEGCLQTFCYEHLPDHRQELSTELNKIEDQRDLIRHTLNEKTADSNKNSLMQQIDQWEQDSIENIQEAAKECEQKLLQHTTKYVNRLETDLAKLTNQIRQSRIENDFDEINLNDFKEKLLQLAKELEQPSSISIQQDATALVNKISVITSESKFINFI